MILYNHESPRRPTTFCDSQDHGRGGAIATSGSGTLALGQPGRCPRLGWAPDYVDAMVRAVRHGTAGDYVIATGTHTVREFVAAAFGHVGVADWHEHVTSIRPLCDRRIPAFWGDASKAPRRPRVAPSKDFRDLVCAMVDHDLALLEGPLRQRRRPDRFPSGRALHEASQRHRDRRAHTVSLAHLSRATAATHKVSWSQVRKS